MLDYLFAFLCLLCLLFAGLTEARVLRSPWRAVRITPISEPSDTEPSN